MAAPLLSAVRRHGWLVVLVTAGVALLVAAVWSPERRSSLADTPAAGALAAVPLEQVRRVVVAQAGRERTLVRQPSGWDGGPAEKIDTGLRLLRNSVPERRFDTATPEFGLDPPELVVRVYADATTPVLEVAFGAANPLGLARYARVTMSGRSELQLLPGYVADTWAAVGSAP